MYSYKIPDAFNRPYISFCGNFSKMESLLMQNVTNSSVFLSIISYLIIILYQYLSCFYSLTISKNNKNIWEQRRFCWFTSIFLKNIIKRLNHDAFIWKILSISSFSWVLYCGVQLSTRPFYVISKKTIFVWTLQKLVKRLIYKSMDFKMIHIFEL